MLFYNSDLVLQKYIKILQNVANRTDIEQYICDVAKGFVEYQLEN